jgi:predicted O-methyltransferase YrrM
MYYQTFFYETVSDNFDKKLHKYKGVPGLTFLQIGAYRGDASKWLLDNILTDTSSYLFDVDIWEKRSRWPGLSEEAYDLSVNGHTNVVKHKETSDDFFNKTTFKFDFVYIDGEFGNKQTYKDCVNSLPKLKDDGLIIVDDYLRADNTPAARFNDITRFIEEYKDKIIVEFIPTQIVIKKSV